MGGGEDRECRNLGPRKIQLATNKSKIQFFNSSSSPHRTFLFIHAGHTKFSLAKFSVQNVPIQLYRLEKLNPDTQKIQKNAFFVVVCLFVLLRTQTHNLQIFKVIPFVNLQNDT